MLKVYNKSHHSDHKQELEYEFFKFPGGELHFKFRFLKNLSIINSISIETDLINSDEIMLLCLMADYFKCQKELKLLYTPYARQDRKTSSEEPFSFKTFARIINACGFDSVVLHDPHSDVTPALIENCRVRKRVDIIPDIKGDFIVVSPDAGAMKANNEIAKKFKLEHVVATKVRDTNTGEITATQVHTDINLEGRELIVFDDICDGGRTFIELAKVLKTHKPKNIHLQVTVGIYSKGLDVLSPYFDSINHFYRRTNNED